MSPLELEAERLRQGLLETARLLRTHGDMLMGLRKARSELHEALAELQEVGWRVDDTCIKAIEASRCALELSRPTPAGQDVAGPVLVDPSASVPIASRAKV